MNFVDNILKTVGLARIKEVPIASGISGSDPFAIWSTGSKKVSVQAAMNANTGWVYACTRAIAEAIAKTEFRLFTVKGENEVETFNHEILDLLNSVNHYQTRFELLYNTAAHLELAGNSYWLLVNAKGEPVKSETEKPVAIFPLSLLYVKPIKAPLPEFIKGYKYRIDGSTQDFKPFQIIHFKCIDPNDPYEGIGTVQNIAEWIDADNAATQFNAAYFKNGARIGGTLESDKAMSVEQQKVLKTSFENLYKGTSNAHKVAILPAGIKYEEKGTTPKDMEFATLQNVSRDKILAGFRVSKTVLGTAESETNRATAETADYVFSERTIKPKVEMIVQQLNEFLVPRFGDNLYLDFHSPTPEDMTAKMLELAAALPGQASMSINEAREIFFGLGPVEGGDNVMGNFSLIPVGTPSAKQVNEGRSKSIGRKGNRQPAVTRYAKNAKIRKSIGSEIADVVAKAFEVATKKTEEIREKAVQDVSSLATMSDDDFEMLYKSFFTRVTPYEKLVSQAVCKFNAQQKTSVLEKLQNKWPTKGFVGKKKSDATDLADSLLGGTDWPQILAQLADPSLSSLYEKEGNEAAALIGTTFAMTEEVRAALKRAITLMTDSYTQTTLMLLEDTLAQGLKDGIGLEEMAANISNIYEFSDAVRSEQVARTEVFRIANESTRTAFKQSGVVESLKWYTAADERVCPLCAPMHGKIVSINDPFFKKGDTVQGDDGSTMEVTYDDVQGGALHVMCRCYIRPEAISIQ